MTDVETVIAARDIAVAAVTTTAANVDLATQQADRAEVARDAAAAPTAAQIATVDADAGSAFRVQQDARVMQKPTSDLGDWALLRRDTSDVTKGVSWTTPSAATARALGWKITTDYASVQAAIDAIPQTGSFRGGTVWIPPGSISESGQWDLRQKENITIAGPGTMSRSYSPTLVTFTRTDAVSCILLGSSNSVKFKGFRIETSSSAYSGKIIDTGASVVADCQMLRLEDMGLKAAGTSATLVSLLHSVGATISRCNFSGGAYGVLGYSDTTGYAIATKYAIAVTIDGQCQFGNHATAAIYNPSYNWNIIGNIFSPKTGGVANAISGDMVTQAKGLSIIGNYFGDAGGSGTYAKVFAQGVTIIGNYFDGDNCTGLFIKRPSYGVHISGNTFRHGGTGVDLDFDSDTGASPTTGAVVTANIFSGTTKVQNHTATNMKVALTGNVNVSDLNPNAPEFSQGFTVGGASGTTFANNGDVTMAVNRVLKGYRLSDSAGTQLSVYLAAIAGHGLTIRSDVATRTPAAARAHASQSVDTFRVEESGGTAHFRVTKATASTPGSTVMGAAALATTATDGFAYLPTMAGTPTGTPTTQTGTAPAVIDTTGSKLWVYVGGAWKSATLA